MIFYIYGRLKCSVIYVGVPHEEADRICCLNRHYAEPSGTAFRPSRSYLSSISQDEPTEYYNSVFGKRVFIGPQGRSFQAYYRESLSHGTYCTYLY